MSSRHLGMHPIERWLLRALVVLTLPLLAWKIQTADAVASRFRIPVAH